MENEVTTADEVKVPEHKNDVKAESPFEFWLKRQNPQHSMRSLREAMKLLNEGAPVPFVAFFQKDAIENLRTRDLYRLMEAKTTWEEIHKKQQYLLQEIQAQGKLTPELKNTIERSTDLDRLEDLYAPFKLKRQSLGLAAREAGLLPLADYIWDKAHGQTPSEIAGETLEQKAEAFVKADTKFANVESVLKGVGDIFVERIAENFELRTLVRGTVLRRSKIRATKGPKAKANSKYSKYFEYQEPIGSLKKSNASHRYLAMRRGWMEDELALSFERPDEGVLLEKFEEFACPHKEAMGAELLQHAARLALKGNVYTVMENEAHRELKEEAEKHVIEVMAENLQKKLLHPAFGAKAVLGIDPGSAQHPCALALLDKDGKFLVHLNFKLEEATDSMKEEFLKSIENLHVQAIAVAHGSRAKEVRDSFRSILASAGKELPIVSVHEHSANIYASSPVAKEEFPELDLNTRRAVFVGRYLQDPLSALLRLETKFFSLGELQHEVNQGQLRHALQETIEFCVNFTGVDVNTAPTFVLSRVAGLNIDIAKSIVQHREKEGAFTSREQLKKLAGMSEKAFRFAAGFLKIPGAANPLENSFVHPMFYEFISSPTAVEEAEKAITEKFGAHVAANIAYELKHLGEDPRGPFEHVEHNPDLKTIADLKRDVAYRGIVTNVTSFGTFVDLGIEQDGLVHISELGSLAKNPHESLFPGDQVTVFVSNVNEEKKQISLTMRDPANKPPQRQRRERPAGATGERRPPRRPREDRRPAPGAAAPVDGAQQAAPGMEGEHPRRPRRDDRRPHRGEQRADSAPKEPKKPKKPNRDPKTGAIVKLDDEYSKKAGPRLPSKAQVVTFNPFANLASMLKDKEKQ